MTRQHERVRSLERAFRPVREVGLSLPGVQTATRYDGSPMLKAAGRFLACLAIHPSAEPGTLVVRYDEDERVWLLDEAPDTYYLPDYYRRFPVILVRLSRVDEPTLRDLLLVSLRLTKNGGKRSRDVRDERLR